MIRNKEVVVISTGLIYMKDKDEKWGILHNSKNTKITGLEIVLPVIFFRMIYMKERDDK